jgi:hypothetical protein
MANVEEPNRAARRRANRAAAKAALGDRAPEPGLQGDYWDSCVICLRGTDTGVVMHGPAEFVVGGLMALGVPPDHATKTFQVAHYGADAIPGPDIVPGRRSPHRPVVPCCADKIKLPIGLFDEGHPETMPNIEATPEQRRQLDEDDE